SHSPPDHRARHSFPTRRSSDLKLIVSRARKVQRFFSQPFFVAAQFTGLEGKYVKLEDTIKGFREIVEGKHDDLPEQAFYMVGTIDRKSTRLNSSHVAISYAVFC